MASRKGSSKNGPSKNGSSKDAVRDALMATVASHSAQDLDEFARHFAPEHSEFDVTGALLFDLAEQGGHEGLKKRMEAAYDGGFKVKLRFRHLEVKVFDNVALAVGYATGSFTQPSGETVNGPWRFTDVRVLGDGKWKSVHTHFSPLKSAC